MKIQLSHRFEDIASVENLLEAWKEFVRGKRSKRDIQEFSFHLMNNILTLHYDLVNRTYRHGGYQAFNISDPKPRNIHKASVRDRLVHHAIYRVLYPFFDRVFIADSYSCRREKGIHKALNRFREFGYKVSRNHTRTCWVLKCDIKKFFASIDQKILMDMLRAYIPDNDILSLLQEVVQSFSSGKLGVGLPLGNLTSQLLVNIYMDELDHYMKHSLKAKYYIRYADDFVILSENRDWLENMITTIKKFLSGELALTLHPDKVFMKTLASSVDFLGWVHFPDHRVLRTATKRKMFRGIKEKGGKQETVQSYFGLMRHGNTVKLRKEVEALLEKKNLKIFRCSFSDYFIEETCQFFLGVKLYDDFAFVAFLLEVNFCAEGLLELVLKSFFFWSQDA